LGRKVNLCHVAAVFAEVVIVLDLLAEVIAVVEEIHAAQVCPP
jgi:hypothetical protein